MRPGRWKCLGVVGATLPLWIPASARMTNSVAGDNYFRTNRPCRLRPAHQSMKSRSCGLVPGIGTVDSATPHPRPLRGTSPRATFPPPHPWTCCPCIGVLAVRQPSLSRQKPGRPAGLPFATPPRAIRESSLQRRLPLVRRRARRAFWLPGWRSIRLRRSAIGRRRSRRPRPAGLGSGAVWNARAESTRYL